MLWLKLQCSFCVFQHRSTQQRRGGNIRGLPVLKNPLISISSQGVRASEVVTSLLLYRSLCHQAAKADSLTCCLESVYDITLRFTGITCWKTSWKCREFLFHPAFNLQLIVIGECGHGSYLITSKKDFS